MRKWKPKEQEQTLADGVKTGADQNVIDISETMDCMQRETPLILANTVF